MVTYGTIVLIIFVNLSDRVLLVSKKTLME